jgi:hypothetical protein
MARRQASPVVSLSLLVASGLCALSYACDGGSDRHPADITTRDAGPADSPGAQDARALDAQSEATSDAPADAPDELTTDVRIVGPEGGALCDPGATWGTPTAVLTTGAADATLFGGVTPDELTLAWASSAGGTVTAWYADRGTTGASFGAPQALSATFGALALDRVSISADGLHIVGALGDGSGFVAARRSSRSGAFDTDDTGAYVGLTNAEGPKSTFATPLLEPDGARFGYLLTSSTTDAVLHESTNGPPWLPGIAQSAAALSRSGGSYRRPSGESLDALALFYWDEVSTTEKLATRPDVSLPFTAFIDLGPLTNAAPTSTCKRVYYSVPAGDAGAGAITIVYADAVPADD